MKTPAPRVVLWLTLLLLTAGPSRAGTFAPKVGDTFNLPPVLQADVMQDPAGRDYLAGKNPALLLSFVPSMTQECVYARMMCQAFDLYFRQGLAFENGGVIPATRPAILLENRDTGGRPQPINYNQGFPSSLHIVHDPQGERNQAVGVPEPDDPNGDSVVVLLDAQRVIRYVSTNYRGHGEQLKVLEKALKRLIDPSQAVDSTAEPFDRTPPQPGLHEGDRAPDFALDGAVSWQVPAKRLAALRGKVVVVSFYPAPFSGLSAADINGYVTASSERQAREEAARVTYEQVIVGKDDSFLNEQEYAFDVIDPKNSLVTSRSTAPSAYAESRPSLTATIHPKYPPLVNPARPPGFRLTLDKLPFDPRLVPNDRVNLAAGCSSQATSFDNLPNALTSPSVYSSSIGGPKAADKPSDVVVLLISTSTPGLVARWTSELGVKNNVMINDPGFRIADLYDSHNPAGYNERTVFIVDRAGVIRYIDRAYQVDDTSYLDLLKKVAEIGR